MISIKLNYLFLYILNNYFNILIMIPISENEKWQSYNNIHKCIQNQNLNSTCFITLKIDGSNCAIRCKKIDECWTIHKIIGRTTILWNSEDQTKQINKLNYGNIGQLYDISDAMFEFTKNIAEYLSKQLELNINDIIIYGEIFRTKEQRFPSWHPFGYKLLEYNIMSMLNYTTYQLFKSNGLIFEDGLFKQFNTDFGIDYILFFKTLENTTGYIICPPPLFFIGSLIDGINNIYPLMINPTNELEGVFIVLDIPVETNTSNIAFKWKTSIHEEQKSIPKLNQLKDPSESLIQIYLKLQNVYNKFRITKVSNIDNDESLLQIKQTKIIDELKSELKISLDKVLSKKESFDSMTQIERKKIIPSLVTEVIEELLSHYDDNIQVPWTIEKIKEYANKLIKPIMN